MQFSQISIFIFAAVVAILATTVEAGQNVKWGKAAAGKSTWFNGHDLKGVACYGDLENNSNVNAQDSWHIAAVHMASYTGGERAACFECVKITANRRSVVVRIIDDCAGCAPNQIDLTASAFKILAPLSQGVVKTSYEFVRCPTSGIKWPKSPAPKSN
ncbi:RlpA-like double-psi beta-barrel-protein domain-containing protein-containing protein [Dissophora ornata]|nr:hypothetical protein BGZ58_004987 [Dissophora ornata]KAI8604791.1 RlpA-like double-psi beta-barrel-protein domain-containing protein-containing protein [Dissophora ornata]